MPAVFGRLPGVELGVSDGFARQRVDVDKRAEPAKRVLQNGRGQSARRANDEEARFIIAARVGVFGNYKMKGENGGIESS